MIVRHKMAVLMAMFFVNFRHFRDLEKGLGGGGGGGTSQTINWLINILECCWFWFFFFFFFFIPFLSVGHIILCCLGAPLSTACCTGTDATCNCNAFGLIHPVPDVCSVESVLCVSSFIVQKAVGFIFCLVLICCYSLTFFFMEGLLYYIFTAHIPFWAVNDFT